MLTHAFKSVFMIMHVLSLPSHILKILVIVSFLNIILGQLPGDQLCHREETADLWLVGSRSWCLKLNTYKWKWLIALESEDPTHSAFMATTFFCSHYLAFGIALFTSWWVVKKVFAKAQTWKSLGMAVIGSWCALTAVCYTQNDCFTTTLFDISIPLSFNIYFAPKSWQSFYVCLQNYWSEAFVPDWG